MNFTKRLYVRFKATSVFKIPLDLPSSKTKIASLLIAMSINLPAVYAAADHKNAKNKFTDTLIVTSDKDRKNTLKSKRQLGVADKLAKEEGLEDKPYPYVVQFYSEPVPLYDGSVKGLKATNPLMSHGSSKNLSRSGSLDLANPKMNKNAPEVRSYMSHLGQEQDEVMAEIRKIVPVGKVLASLKFALNAVIIEMTPSQAEQVSALKEVKFVERNPEGELENSPGVSITGAPDAWTGFTDDGMSVTGEGIVIGIIDSGINIDHPSFAPIDADGYRHQNPIQGGGYLGDCVDKTPDLCNDKLIGLYSYSIIHNVYDDTDVFAASLPKTAEDYTGHGSNVAGIAAGNYLNNVPLLRTENKKIGDGIPTDVEFPRISGVAPHANVIAYQVCYPGNRGDRYNTCPGGLLAIEDAIADGVVDVLNYSISSASANPWARSVESAFLAARNAGIFVATSVGNDGTRGTTKSAPWYTTVAASTHGAKLFAEKSITGIANNNSDLGQIIGQGIGEGVTGELVYAGNLEGRVQSVESLATCSEPFPPGTFDNQIVLCDRGNGPRITKADNVSSGGAVGLILANVENGSDSLDIDQFSIPGIHIDQSSGEHLKAWLSQSDSNTITISDATDIREIVDTSQTDLIADFSSRGPNPFLSTLAPTLAAPGVAIYAAHTDQDLGNNNTQPASADFRSYQGTSMASPHVAGAAALIKEAHPRWTPDNIRSALAMTSEKTLRLSNGDAASWFNMGSGRIRVDKAIDTGLVMNETAGNYLNANPEAGGDPSTLNLPSIVSNTCVRTCSFTRSVTATKDGKWEVSSNNDNTRMRLTVSPSQFELRAGETQLISVEANISNVLGTLSFGEITFESPISPTLHIPVAITKGKSSIPESLMVRADRDFGSFLVRNLVTFPFDDLQIDISSANAKEKMFSVAVEENSETIFDDITMGTAIYPFEVTDDTLRIIGKIKSTTADAFDLYLIRDNNKNGIPEENEIVSKVGSDDVNPSPINSLSPEKGRYWFVIHNRNFYVEGGQNDFVFEYTIVNRGINELALAAEAPSSNSGTPFNLRFIWDLPQSVEGDTFYTAVELGSEPDSPVDIGFIALDVLRTKNDVELKTTQNERVKPGETIQYEMIINANNSSTNRDYELVLQIPENVVVDTASLPDEAKYETETRSVTWNVRKLSTALNPGEYRITSNEFDRDCRSPFAFNNFGYVDLSELGVEKEPFPDETRHVFIEKQGFPIPFLGLDPEIHTSLQTFSFSDDGLISFRDADTMAAFTNVGLVRGRTMPDVFGLNGGLIAPFLRDFAHDSAVSGIYYFVPNTNIAILEWENMRLRDFFGEIIEGDTLDFEIIMDTRSIEGVPDFVFAYNNVNHDFGASEPVTIGYENIEGTEGKVANHVGRGQTVGNIETDIVDGRMICMYLEAEVRPEVLQLNLIPTADFKEPRITLELKSTILSDDYSKPEVITNDVVIVEQPPEVLINNRATLLTHAFEGDTVELQATATDANDDSLSTWEWSQVAGPVATLNRLNPKTLELVLPEVDGAEFIRIHLDVTDEFGNAGSSDAYIVIANSEPTK